MSGRGLIFPLVALKKNHHGVLFLGHRTDVITADITDKRQRENNREKASKNKNSALELNTKQRCNRSEDMWRERERLWNWRSEKERDLTEKVWLSSVWQCTGGRGACLISTWDRGGPGGWVVLVITEFCPERNRREVWSVLEHLHAGLQLGGMNLRGPSQNTGFSLSCSFLNRSLIPYPEWNPGQ